jgi:hypothetical protein
MKLIYIANARIPECEIAMRIIQMVHANNTNNTNDN